MEVIKGENKREGEGREGGREGGKKSINVFRILTNGHLGNRKFPFPESLRFNLTTIQHLTIYMISFHFDNSALLKY